MRKPKHTKIRLIFICATAFLLSLSIYCYFRINDLTKSYYLVGHTNTVKLELEKFASTIKDIESSSRGFLLTKDSIYLDEFYLHLKKIDPKIDLLRVLTKDNKRQQIYVDTLEKLTAKRVSAIVDAVKIGSVDKIPEAQREKNKTLRLHFRKHINMMMSVEEAKLKQRTRLMERQSSLTPLFTVLLMISALIALILSYYGINRELKISDQLKDHLEESKNLLTEKNETLQTSNENLAAVNKELEAFTYISSHDLQEPLRKIQTLISLMFEKESAALSDSGKNYLNRIRNSSERMQALIKDLLAYSRVSTEEFQFAETCLNLMINEVIEDLDEELKAKNAVVEVKGETRIVVIPTQFRQLLTNLISNAVKFSREGIDPHIVIESKTVSSSEVNFEKAVPGKNYTLFTVSDNGIGFDRQYRERIFEVFQRLYSDQQYAGTGIGLAIVKKIVENHHGFISAESKEGAGAVFSVYIPS